MLAARNNNFRLAALFAAVTYLILTAGETVDANRILGLSGIPAGYGISAVILPVAYVVGACGWAVVASAFGAEIDWARLRRGGAVVVAALVAVFVATVVRSVVELEPGGTADFVIYIVLAAITGLFAALAAAAVLVASTDSRRGASRARWLWSGACFLGAGNLAGAASVVFQLIYLSDLAAEYFGGGLPAEFTAGMIVFAVAAVGSAIAAAIFARGVTRGLARREAALFVAALVAVGATLGKAAGEGLIAYVYRDAPGSVLAPHWLSVAAHIVSAISVVLIAFGARAAVRAVAGPAPVPD